MVVTVTFIRDDDGRVDTFIYQDHPEHRDDGDKANLAPHEALELLNRLGLTQPISENLLELVLSQPTRVRRRQFELDAQHEIQLRQQFFPGPW